MLIDTGGHEDVYLEAGLLCQVQGYHRYVPKHISISPKYGRIVPANRICAR